MTRDQLFGYTSGVRWLQASMRVKGWAKTKGSIKEQIALSITLAKNQTYETEWEIGFTNAILDSLN